MKTILQSIHWQLSPHTDENSVVQGIEDIHQCITTILSTPKGLDVLRPEFGSDHFHYLDRPEDIALPNFTREITEALMIWEKRIDVIRIVFSGSAPHYGVMVEWKLKDGIHKDLVQQTEIDLWHNFSI